MSCIKSRAWVTIALIITTSVVLADCIGDWIFTLKLQENANFTTNAIATSHFSFTIVGTGTTVLQLWNIVISLLGLYNCISIAEKLSIPMPVELFLVIFLAEIPQSSLSTHVLHTKRGTPYFIELANTAIVETILDFLSPFIRVLLLPYLLFEQDENGSDCKKKTYLALKILDTLGLIVLLGLAITTIVFRAQG